VEPIRFSKGHLSIHWHYLLLSLVLLLPPIPLSGAQRRYVESVRRKTSSSVLAMMGQWQNWADLVRAVLGVFLLTQVAIIVDPAARGVGVKALTLKGGILTVAILLQIVRLGRTSPLIAPIFYLCGFTLVWAGYVEGGFAVFTGWLFLINGNHPVYQLPIMAATLAIAGFFLSSMAPLIVLSLALNCALILLPLLLAFFFQKPLAVVAIETHMPTSD
jgi:hypothetical protein